MELRAKREEEERKRREEKRRQQQQQEEQKRRQEEEELFRRKQVRARLCVPGCAFPRRWLPARARGQAAGPHRAAPVQVRQQELLLKLLQQQQAVAAVPVPPAPSSPPPLWAGLAKQGLSMKTLLELQLEGERQLHKQPAPREPSRAQAPNHRVVSRLALPPLSSGLGAVGSTLQSAPRVTWGGGSRLAPTFEPEPWSVSDSEAFLFRAALPSPHWATSVSLPT